MSDYSRLARIILSDSPPKWEQNTAGEFYQRDASEREFLKNNLICIYCKKKLKFIPKGKRKEHFRHLIKNEICHKNDFVRYGEKNLEERVNFVNKEHYFKLIGLKSKPSGAKKSSEKRGTTNVIDSDTDSESSSSQENTTEHLPQEIDQFDMHLSKAIEMLIDDHKYHQLQDSAQNQCLLWGRNRLVDELFVYVNDIDWRDQNGFGLYNDSPKIYWGKIWKAYCRRKGKNIPLSNFEADNPDDQVYIFFDKFENNRLQVMLNHAAALGFIKKYSTKIKNGHYFAVVADEISSNRRDALHPIIFCNKYNRYRVVYIPHT